MGNTDLAERVRATERALRECIRAVLSAEYGDGWIERTGLTLDRLQTFRERRAVERRRRSGATVPAELIEYSEIEDLAKIISRHWESFKPIFHNKKTFDVWMEHLSRYRHPTMHSRDLLPHETELLRGITGSIRNLVTLSRSQRDPNNRYFPVLESVTDSFGHVVTQDLKWVETDVILHPGDEVTFECRGWDPTGAELRWWCDPSVDGVSALRHKAEGSLIVWNVKREHIAEKTWFWVFMVADRDYHRHGSCDAHVGFSYRVLPPRPPT